MARRGIIVTATDTGAGKTLVSSAIARALARRGLRVVPFKPMETGCRDAGHGLVGEDCEKLVEASRSGRGADDISAYLLRQPAAPLVAAEAEGVRIEREVLLAKYEELSAGADFILVETAGGLMVPIADGWTTRELLRELALPAIVVVASRLGCINHALLTFEAMRGAGIPIAGYVMNEIGDASGEYALALMTNREVMARYAGCRDLGEMPNVEASLRKDYDGLAALAEQALDLDAILAATR